MILVGDTFGLMGNHFILNYTLMATHGVNAVYSLDLKWVTKGNKEKKKKGPGQSETL